MQNTIDAFLSHSTVAVVGASNDQSKYGNRIFRHYLAHDRTPIPIHPRAAEIEGVVAYPNLAAAHQHHPLRVASIITPPAVTASVVDQAITLGFESLWMQPRAEHPEAIARAEEAGINVIWGGPCVLVSLK